jgi:hypothetical protein
VRNISVLYIEGTFASMHQGKNVALSFSFCHGTKSNVSWKLLELRGGLSLGSGPFSMHSVTGELG